MCYFLSIFDPCCWPPMQIVIYWRKNTLELLTALPLLSWSAVLYLSKHLCSEMLAFFGEREPRSVSFSVVFSLTYHFYCNLLIVLSLYCHIWKRFVWFRLLKTQNHSKLFKTNIRSDLIAVLVVASWFLLELLSSFWLNLRTRATGIFLCYVGQSSNFSYVRIECLLVVYLWSKYKLKV